MTVSYTKLWKLLIDKNMSKTQLIKDAKISTNAMAKLGKKRSQRFFGQYVKHYMVNPACSKRSGIGWG